jgi:hypothetical protein
VDLGDARGQQRERLLEIADRAALQQVEVIGGTCPAR